MQIFGIPSKVNSEYWRICWSKKIYEDEDINKSQSDDCDECVDQGEDIPDICHFFYTGKILENKMYTEKRQFFRVKSVKNATFSRKICRKCQFFALNQ